MQTNTTPSAVDSFRARRATYTRPKLSSEIVRPVFQRGIGGDNDSDVTKSSTRGFKRIPSLGDSHMTRSVLPPIATAFISPSKYPHAEPYVASRYSDKYAPTNGDDALALVANCASEQGDHSGLVQPQLKRKRIRLKTERRREQCRANQARYRQKQLNHAKILEETVIKLRADIPVLELQRNRLLYGGQQNVWNVVVEYFHVFHFGVPVTMPVAAEDGSVSTTSLAELLENAETKHQLAFLRSSMTEDVILGERIGVEALMEQWRLYSSSFQSLYFQLERIERTNDAFVSVSAMLNVMVSETTLRHIFPNLVDDEEPGDEYEDNDRATAAFVRSKLLGRRLLVPCTLCFEWDATSCRVARLETTVNFMTPLMKVLGNLSDVALVLEHALITRDGAVGVRDLKK